MICDPRIRSLLSRRFPFLKQSEGDFQDAFFQSATLLALEPGRSICHEGDRCTSLPLVYEGSTRIFKVGASGREITLYRLGAGESCVLTASCILGGTPFPADAVCETRVQAVALPAAQVVAWLSDSAAWRAFVFTLVAERLQRIIQVVDDVVFRRMDQRLAEYLARKSSQDGTAWLPLTHQQIADDLGTSREVISRLLKDFDQDGLIEGGRGRLRVIEPEKLAGAGIGRLGD